MSRVYEIQGADAATRVSMFNQQLRDDIARVVSTLGISGEAPVPIVESSITNNAITLPRGTNYGCLLQVADTVVEGLTAGCYMTRKAKLEADATFDGINFSSSESNTEELVDIRGTSVGVFRNCTFEKFTTDSTTFIKVANGAKALFVGCIFKGNPSIAGNLFEHAGAAGNIQIVGCYNKTTHAYGTATATASL